MIDINDLWTVVAATKRQFLAIEFLDKTKVYLVESFAPKTRDVYFNEVRGAQDVTDLIEHMAFQMSQLNPISFEERIQGRSKKDFKFGHDNYMWLISDKENVY